MVTVKLKVALYVLIFLFTALHASIFMIFEEKYFVAMVTE